MAEAYRGLYERCAVPADRRGQAAR
jgi:hypothetical protein